MTIKTACLLFGLLLVSKFSVAQEKIVPSFPDNMFYNFQTGQSRVNGALSKNEKTWKELFKEKGIFNRDVANKFKDTVLSKGGSIHPMELYVAFRGQEPNPDALLRRAGLLK